jgi:type I restriction enzyme S subunit
MTPPAEKQPAPPTVSNHWKQAEPAPVNISNHWKIPASWTWKTMGDISEVIGGGTPKTSQAEFYGGIIPWITPADLSGYKDKFISRGARNITQTGLDHSGAKLMPAGTVLFSSRAPIGYVAIAANPVSTNQGFKSFVLHDGLEPDFVYHYLHHAKKLAVELASGTTFLEISGKKAAQIPIPVPPLSEQREIVAEIEKQFTRLDAGTGALKRVQANLKRYRAAVLKAACSGELVFADTGWPQTQIVTAIQTMDQGWSPKCESEPSADDATWAVIKTTAIQNLRFDEVENKKLPSALKPRPHLELQAGDLLVTRAGPRNRVGVACLVKTTRPRLMLCDKAYRLRCKPDVVIPAFLELVLNAPHIIDEVNKLKTGISDSGVNLTQKRFGELRIPLPPLAEQKRIVEEVERRLSVVEELEAVVEASLKRAGRLRQSILKKAFEGRLV